MKILFIHATSPHGHTVPRTIVTCPNSPTEILFLLFYRELLFIPTYILYNYNEVLSILTKDNKIIYIDCDFIIYLFIYLLMQCSEVYLRRLLNLLLL